jgi:hypothetical protein
VVNGDVDQTWKDGEVVAERHRHDNRLSIAVLNRLDMSLRPGPAQRRADAAAGRTLGHLPGGACRGSHQRLRSWASLGRTGLARAIPSPHVDKEMMACWSINFINSAPAKRPRDG